MGDLGSVLCRRGEAGLSSAFSVERRAGDLTLRLAPPTGWRLVAGPMAMAGFGATMSLAGIVLTAMVVPDRNYTFVGLFGTATALLATFLAVRRVRRVQEHRREPARISINREFVRLTVPRAGLDESWPREQVLTIIAMDAGLSSSGMPLIDLSVITQSEEVHTTQIAVVTHGIAQAIESAIRESLDLPSSLVHIPVGREKQERKAPAADLKPQPVTVRIKPARRKRVIPQETAVA